MIVTCLKCGKQFHLYEPVPSSQECECGAVINPPKVQGMGTLPNERAAERARQRAFLSAGIINNTGLTALYLSLFGLVIPILGIIACGVALYLLITKSGAIARWSGRNLAIIALTLGIFETSVHGTFFRNWYKELQEERIITLQQEARRDLKALLRAQRNFYAYNERYGLPDELNFKAPVGNYTIYFGEFAQITSEGKEHTVYPYPEELSSGLTAQTFTALAVANIDSDEFLDVWSINHYNQLKHIYNDALNLDMTKQIEQKDQETPEEQIIDSETEDLDPQLSQQAIKQPEQEIQVQKEKTIPVHEEQKPEVITTTPQQAVPAKLPIKNPPKTVAPKTETKTDASVEAKPEKLKETPNKVQEAIKAESKPAAAQEKKVPPQEASQNIQPQEKAKQATPAVEQDQKKAPPPKSSEKKQPAQESTEKSEQPAPPNSTKQPIQEQNKPTDTPKPSTTNKEASAS